MKGMVNMAMTSDILQATVPADNVSGSRQGHWTYTSYAALPDDGKRYEIVDGVLYMSPSPSPPHQRIAGRFYYYLLTYVEFIGLGLVFQAPLDVQLTPDRVVQPDVFVLLNSSLHKYTETYIIGAPDLVVEIASPSTAIFDRHEKLEVYAKSGVPEYWIVEPGTKTVEVLALHAGAYRSLGIFRGRASLPSRVVPEIAKVAVEQFFSIR
jgi:Uma2 family endonuclease